MTYEPNAFVGFQGTMRGREYAQLKAFVTVVAQGNFARAAAELRLSPSTLSQTIRELESRLGARLLNRTTRSVSLTEAGQRLHARFKPAMLEMEAAVRDAANRSDRPAGVVRVHTPVTPAAAYLEPVLGDFHANYPEIVLDVTVEDSVPDLVETGYDLGVRPGDALEGDMVAVRLGSEQRQLVVGSPDYVARHGRPATPADLSRHRCINWRQPGGTGLHKWQFVRNGRWFSVAVDGPLVVSQRDLAVAAAVQGVGLAFRGEELLRPLIDRGKLVPVLEEWCGTFPGWYLCYSRQRCIAPGVRAFIDFLKSSSDATPGTNARFSGRRRFEAR